MLIYITLNTPKDATLSETPKATPHYSMFTCINTGRSSLYIFGPII